jgi:hypothetical protein
VAVDGRTPHEGERAAGFLTRDCHGAAATDVLIVSGPRRTGIEVTEINQSPRPGKRPLRVHESERARIVAGASAVAERARLPVLDVALSFNEHVPITKNDRNAIVNGLVELVRAMEGFPSCTPTTSSASLMRK